MLSNIAIFYVFQNLFLEMKKLEIKKTKIAYSVSFLKVVY